MRSWDRLKRDVAIETVWLPAERAATEKCAPTGVAGPLRSLYQAEARRR